MAKGSVQSGGKRRISKGLTLADFARPNNAGRAQKRSGAIYSAGTKMTEIQIII